MTSNSPVHLSLPSLITLLSLQGHPSKWQMPTPCHTDAAVPLDAKQADTIIDHCLDGCVARLGRINSNRDLLGQSAKQASNIQSLSDSIGNFAEARRQGTNSVEVANRLLSHGLVVQEDHEHILALRNFMTHPGIASADTALDAAITLLARYTERSSVKGSKAWPSELQS